MDKTVQPHKQGLSLLQLVQPPVWQITMLHAGPMIGAGALGSRAVKMAGSVAATLADDRHCESFPWQGCDGENNTSC